MLRPSLLFFLASVSANVFALPFRVRLAGDSVQRYSSGYLCFNRSIFGRSLNRIYALFGCFAK